MPREAAVAGLGGIEVVGGNPLGGRVDQGEVGAAARLDAHGLEPHDDARVDGHELDHAAPADRAGVHQVGEHRAQAGLDAGHAEGRQLELAGLLVVGVGGVIGGDAVDGAVGDALDELGGVLCGAKRRVHLERGGVVVADVVLGQEQVVRGDLAGDAHAGGLGAAHELEPVGAGEVLDVQVGAGELGQLDVAGDVDLLAGRGPAQHAQAGGGDALVDLAGVDQALVLAVVHDGAAELYGVVHDAAHHAGVLDAAAVVGEGHGAVGAHVAHLGEHLALEAAGARAGHVHAAHAGRGGAVADELDAGGGVGDGVGVGHADDVGEAAVHRGAAAGGDVLLVLEAGLPQVDVDVDQAGHEHAAGGVAHAGALRGGEALTHGGDAAALNEHVDDGVQPDLRVNRAGAPNQRCLHLLLLQAAGTVRPSSQARRSIPGRG